MDRLLPADEDPGATGLGCDLFLLKLLEGDGAEFLECYRAGLDALEAENAFSSLGAHEQDEVLAKLEEGVTATPWPIDAKSFFDLMLRHTIEGAYSDPGNGGNLNEAAWQMVGFEVTA